MSCYFVQYFFEARSKNLTNNNELHPDLFGPEPVDRFAHVNPSVVLVGELNLQRLPSRAISFPHEVDVLPILGPLDDGGRVGGDGTHQTDVLPNTTNHFDLLLLSLGWTFLQRENKKSFNLREKRGKKSSPLLTPLTPIV